MSKHEIVGQITLDQWMETKRRLQAELLGVRKSFVRIGYLLRQVEESEGYKVDGYDTVAEWAKGEYGIEASTTSRFISINKEYSVGGYSEELLPEYEDFKRSQLEEMLKLPATDRAMITPNTPRADIRELKAFNKQEEKGIADDLKAFLNQFIADNGAMAADMRGKDTEQMKEAMIPSGNKTYRKGLFFLMANEQKVIIKKYGGQPEEYTWQQFTQILSDIFEERNRREDEERLAKKNQPQNVVQNQAVELGDEEPNEEIATGGGDNHTAQPVAEIVGPEGSEENGHHGGTGLSELGENRAEIHAEEEAGRTRGGTAAGYHEGEASGDGEADCEVESGAGEAEEAVAELIEPDEQGAEAFTEEEKTPVTAIAPAQKTSERLEKEHISDPVSEVPEPFMNAPGVMEKTFGSRKDYIDSLTEWGMADYLKKEYMAERLKETMLYRVEKMTEYLKEPVTDKGYTWEE